MTNTGTPVRWQELSFEQLAALRDSDCSILVLDSQRLL